jgi:hypothetical protein
MDETLLPETWICAECQVGGKEVLPVACWMCGKKIHSAASRIYIGAESIDTSPAFYLAATIAFSYLDLQDSIAGMVWPSAVLSFQPASLARVTQVVRRRLARELRQRYDLVVLPTALEVSWVSERAALGWWEQNVASGNPPWPRRRCIAIGLFPSGQRNLQKMHDIWTNFPR